MKDIELVIKMTEEVYKSIINGKNYISYQEYVEEAIKNGTPLPKGHGGLIDEKELVKYIIRDNCEDGCGYIDERDLIDIPIVILGDKE